MQQNKIKLDVYVNCLVLMKSAAKIIKFMIYSFRIRIRMPFRVIMHGMRLKLLYMFVIQQLKTTDGS